MKIGRRWPLLGVLALLALVLPLAATADTNPFELLPGTAILLDQSSGSGSGGNATSTSNSTNIFSPAAFVDYKRFGGEPTVVVDRYPFTNAAQCSPNPAPCYKDLVYTSSPQGVVEPHYSTFYKSDDLGQTFRVPTHTPFTAFVTGTTGGGGDSHLVVGAVSHRIYFVDLALSCITINTSTDLGESWTSDQFGCGANLLDDRQWVEADEQYPGLTAQGGWVYISAINLANPALPTLMASRAPGNTAGQVPGAFVASSPCNPGTFAVGSNPVDPAANDGVATPCPDPADPYLYVAGPVVADKTMRTGNASHPVYVPFVRRISQGGLGLDCPCPWQLYVAKSIDGGTSWTRHKVADLPNTADPGNIFVQLAIDRAGNLYYDWSQAQVDPNTGAEGEQDIYYTYSQGGGLAGTWAPPIDLTGEANDSAIFPWMVAGDAGKVDLVYYKSNNGENSNASPPTTVWNVYFGQSMNALNPGANFKSVQVSAEPNHLGPICTGGTGCTSGDRDLLDFFTVDVDHLGAAHIVYSDDHQRRNTDTRDKLTRQIAGNSIFNGQNITLQSSWPIHDHSVTDRAGDVYDGFGANKGSCPGMDLLGASSSRSNGLLTVSLTMNAPPSAAAAMACSPGAATGGLWGAEFWAASSQGGTDGGNTFYLAYRDNPGDGAPRAEAGAVDSTNATVTSLEFDPQIVGSPVASGGTCFSATPPSPCTLTVSVPLSALGISPGNGLYSLTGLSTYFFGTTNRPPLLRVEGGNSEQADATAPIEYSGSGTP
jgi:hypothetical protein